MAGAHSAFRNTATDGAQRAFPETLLKTVIQSCRQQGGDPSTILVGPINEISGKPISKKVH